MWTNKQRKLLKRAVIYSTCVRTQAIIAFALPFLWMFLIFIDDVALIEDVYHYTLDFLDNVESYDTVGIKEAIERDSIESSYMQAMKYVNYMYEHFEEYQLLLKYSKGSRVENFIEEIADQYTKQNAQFVKAAYEAGYAKCLPSDIEIHILTHGYITALCECILHDVPYEKAEDYVKNIIKFQHYGWYGVLGLPIK